MQWLHTDLCIDRRRAGLAILVGGGLMALAGGSGAEELDTRALAGCWRSQHVELHFEDGRESHTNLDCITAFGPAGHARSLCNLGSHGDDREFSYRMTSPGELTMKTTRVDGRPAPDSPATIEHVRIDGSYLYTTTNPAPTAEVEHPPKEVTALSVRVALGSEGADPTDARVCAPLGVAANKPDFLSVSSLALRPPAGWREQAIVQNQAAQMIQVLDGNFLIGVYAASDPRGPVVFASEDYRPGAKPVSVSEFAALKARMQEKLGTARVTCQDARRICFDQSVEGSSDGSKQPGRMTTAFVLAAQRVAVIYSVVHNTTDAAQQAVHSAVAAFADQLVADNP